jgi:GTP-binding protein HflX
VRLDQIDQVDEVLGEIDAHAIRQILVFNKIDAVPELAARGDAVERDEYGNISRVFLSARTGQGVDTLRAAIAEIFAAESLPALAALPALPDAGDFLPGAGLPAELHDDDRKVSEHGR